jgi:hypothetical protein
MIERLRQNRVAFYLGNFSRFSAKTGAVVVDRTLTLEADIRFPSIVDLVARIGLFDALTFVSVTIFERERFLAIDHGAFLGDHTWFAHVYMYIEAFAGRGSALIADPIVVQGVDEARWRAQWRETHGRSHLYLHTIGTLKALRKLRERGVLPATFLADVQEPELVSTTPRVETTRSTAVAILKYLANFVAVESQERRALSGEEWQFIHEEYALLGRQDLMLMLRHINFASERMRLLQQIYDADIALLNDYLKL